MIGTLVVLVDSTTKLWCQKLQSEFINFNLPRLEERIRGWGHGCRFAGVGVDVEIFGVTLMLDNGLVGHHVLLRLHVGPEGIRGALGHEPLASLDVVHTILEVTESLFFDTNFECFEQIVDIFVRFYVL